MADEAVVVVVVVVAVAVVVAAARDIRAWSMGRRQRKAFA